MSLSVHPAGVIAAQSSMDSYIRVFDVNSNSTVVVIDCLPSESWAIAFDPKVRRTTFPFLKKIVYLCWVTRESFLPLLAG